WTVRGRGSGRGRVRLEDPDELLRQPVAALLRGRGGRGAGRGAGGAPADGLEERLGGDAALPLAALGGEGDGALGGRGGALPLAEAAGAVRQLEHRARLPLRAGRVGEGGVHLLPARLEGLGVAHPAGGAGEVRQGEEAVE